MLKPIAAAVLAVAAATGLAGCNGSQMVGLVSLGDSRGYLVPPVPVEDALYYIAPLDGVPGNIGDRFSRMLVRAAEAEGITVVRRADRPADLRVVGHLSAISGDTSSVIFYDFDVIDISSGALLHRISGQQTSDASRADPWAGVEIEDLRHMAEVVAARLGAWIRAARS